MNCIYKWALDRVNPEKMEEWLFNLNEYPLPGEMQKKIEPTPDDLAADGEAFMAAMRQQGKV